MVEHLAFNQSTRVRFPVPLPRLSDARGSVPIPQGKGLCVAVCNLYNCSREGLGQTLLCYIELPVNAHDKLNRMLLGKLER